MKIGKIIIMSIILGILMAVTIIASRNYGRIALTTGILYVIGLIYTMISTNNERKKAN